MYYTYLESPIGPIFVAGEDDTCSFLSFTSGHQVRRPQPDWIDDAAPLRFATEQLEQYFAGERTQFDLRLDMRGTDFQKRCWDLLMTIPFGEAWTYGQIAQQLGSPGAARAVGRANATNHLPIVVPCHRVIGSDGSLTGFGGGMEAKQWLLRFEGALAPASRAAGQSALF
jgi:methylated-DNA-[protein]-cysteine S-methyltransferase